LKHLMNIRLAFLRAALAVLLFPASMQAQNLVPNPGFETLNSCPAGVGDVAFDAGYSNFPVVQGWISPLHTTPDIFNVCASPVTTPVSVPESHFGHQYPHNGNGFAGIIVWQGMHTPSGYTDYMEYLQCKLLQPLNPGQRYCVTFYVNNAIATQSSHSNFNFVGVDQVGVNFSTTKITQPSVSALTMNIAMSVNNQPGNFITDTSAWKKISAVYIASGGEQWMTVGCAYNGTAPNRLQLFPATPNPNIDYRSYIYFDDFSVVAITPADTIKRSFDSLACKQSGLGMKLKSPGDEGISWSTGATTQNIIINTPGTYWCRSIYNCQVSIDTFHVIYDPSKHLSAGNDTGNCFDQPIVLNANPGFSGYMWSTGQGSSSITVTQTGTYIVSASNECGLQSDTVEIYIQPPTPAPAVTDTTVCQFTDNPKLNISGIGINWYTHIKGIFGFPYQPVITTSQPGAFTFYISQTIGKCESERVPMTIHVRYTPHEEMKDLEKMCERLKDTIGTYSPDVEYKWSTGEMSCCIIPDHEGLYKRAATNECGNYIDTVRVEFSLCDECVAIANAYAPYNQDGTYNLFKPIVYCPVKDFRFRIFNRWGQMVFNSTDPTAAWNGFHEYQPCDQGVYVYMLEYRSISTGNPKLLKGNITLLK
jgi:gliding motility-associated-like protein